MNTISFLGRVSNRFHKLKLLACSSLLAGLAACGGGGGDSATTAQAPLPNTLDSASGTATSVNLATATSPNAITTTTTTTTNTTTVTATATLAPLTYTAASVAQQCVAPRTGEGFVDKQGSIDTEKLWVKAHMSETYLWYKDSPVVDPAPYTAAAFGGSVFNALRTYFSELLTPKMTASGKPVDEFSFAIPTATRLNQQAGISSGYGIRFARLQSSDETRVIRVLFVEPNSPGDLAGVRRGDTVKSVDGVDINDTTQAGIAKIDEGFSPTTAAKTTVFGLQGAGATEPCDVTVVSSTSVAVTPVEFSKTFKSGTSTVGYMVLNSFLVTSAQPQLIEAINKFKHAGVNELVLDLRYNGGGFLAISNQLSWMIGDASLADKVYEKNICNDKNSLEICNTESSFIQQTIGDTANNVTPGQALPQLGLKRVFVLTSASTCSASESLVNGLSPFLQVVRIGSTTCGKPYGFLFQDNCGTSYAPMQFKGVNAKGFGDFADGFAPTCAVADDLSKQRGDTAELMLAGAVNYMKTGSCPAASTGSQKLDGFGPFSYKMMRSPLEENRILNLPGSPVR